MATEQDLRRGQAQAAENATVNVSLTPVEQPKFTNLKLQRDIILNDFVFNTIDEFGVVWVITDINGWWSPPPAEVPDITRGWGDGSYDVQGRYAARSFTLSGVFLTPDPSMVEAARDRLMAAVNLVYRGAWLLTGSDPIRASWVRVSDQATFNTVNPRGRTEFQIPLRAPDPIKYSWNDSQPDGYDYVEFTAKNYKIDGSGSIAIENIGNYPVPCLIEISGPITGPATLYNNATDQLIIVTSSFGGSLSARVDNKQLSFNTETLQDIATLTTRTPHGFTAGSSIYVSGVGEPFDGDYVIESVPTETTLTYVRLPEVAIVKQVAYKTLNAGVATIETTTNHSFSVGDRVVISGVDGVFDGTYTVDSVPNSSTFTYKTSRVPEASVIGRILTSNVATLTTSAPHGFLVGEEVTVSGVDSTNFDGTYTISDVSKNGLQFSYARNRTDSKVVTNTALSAQKATITTSTPHGFVVGERAAISGVSPAYNGTYEIESTPTKSTFTFTRTRSQRISVATKSASNKTATITTSTQHNLVPGDQVIVQNVDSTFNGTYTVDSTPSSTAFTYFKDAEVSPTTVVGGFVSVNGRWIARKSLIGNVATLTTLSDHGILVGESVTITNVDGTFDGTYTVTAATNNTFSYVKTGTNIPDSLAGFVISKILRVSQTALDTVNTAQATYNAADLALRTAIKNAEQNIIDRRTAVTTAETNLKIKDAKVKEAQDFVKAVEFLNPIIRQRAQQQLNDALAEQAAAQAALDSAKTALETAENTPILDVPAVKTASDALAAAQTALNNANEALAESTGSAATVTTLFPHGFSTGNTVFISGISDPTFNGVYIISVVSPTQFSYTTVASEPVFEQGQEPGDPLEGVPAGDGAAVVRGRTTYSGNIASTAVSGGTAEVAGSLPFVSVSGGKATVSENIERTLANSGAAIQKNDIQFTPGVENGFVAVNADILEIDTQNREVAFNGEIAGARAKIDVLADFIKLAPGQNVIEFKDDGNVESSAVCKIFYRSGWLS